MTALDLVVCWRERAIDAVSGVRPGSVLNGAGGGGEAGAPRAAAAPEAARRLQQAVNGLLVEAATDARDRLAYGALAASPAYRDFRAGPPAMLGRADLEALRSREERLAFWINVYNALIIDAVIAFHVRRSVAEGPLGYVAFFRKAAYLVGGRRFSADDIEHGVLRANRGHPFIPGPQFGPGDPRRHTVVAPPDPRIHFALNCGSRSCPPIAAYEAEAIHRQLDLAASGFVASDVEIQAERGLVRVSRMFRWFGRDFGGRAGVLALIRRYLPEGDARRRWLVARGGNVRLTYRPYDWSLNAV